MKIDAEDLAILIVLEGIGMGVHLEVTSSIAKARLDKLIKFGLVEKLTRNTPSATHKYIDSQRTPHSIDISGKGRLLVWEVKKVLTAIDCEYKGEWAHPKWSITVG